MEPIHRIRKFIFNNSLNFDVTTFNVEGVTRRLHTTWTPELAQDLQTFHQIDAEAELTRLLSEEIARNIDRQIINTFTQDWVTVQPTGGLYYYDFQFQLSDQPMVYKDGSWSLENYFESSIGIKSQIRKFQLV